MKIHLLPEFADPDRGDGGIRRIVEAQRQHLPDHGFEFVSNVQQADIVATHSGGIADVPVHKPFVMHTHGLYWREYQWPDWCHKLNQIVIDGMKEADIATVPSEWVGEAIRRGMWTDPVVLYHGVNMDEWTPGNNGQYVLWNKSRPDPVCDPRVVDALAIRLPSRRFVTTFGRSDLSNVRVTGRVPYQTAKEFIQNAGVYLCTARETFGIGTLEAMASGVPVVGWAWGGQREFINHGITGWLAKPGDYQGLIEGIEWAFTNREKIAAAAREIVEDRFQWKDRILDYATVYDAAYNVKADSYHRPAVSVIVPCYNLARFVPDAIQSVIAQSFTNWELIVVDDCSPDNTEAVVRPFLTDQRIKYLRTPENLYLAGALNFGVKHSQGRYILPLDADNMIEPNSLSEFIRALEGSRKIDIAYGAVRFVLEDGHQPDQSVGRNGISGWPQDFDFRGQMLQRNQVPSTALIRREAIETAGGWRTRCATAEDAENWTRLSSLGFRPSKVTNGSTLIYRQRNDSMSRVVPKWDFNSWFPWARDKTLTPFGAAAVPPRDLNGGIAWNVPSFEPISVSVVIPVGPGHKRFVMDAIDSIVAQSFQSWEIIVVDDSKEPWPAGQPTFPSFVKIVRGDQRGPGAARNRAVGVARGELILPLDADDYLQPDALMTMVNAIQHYGGYVYSQWWDDFGTRREIYDPPDYSPNLLLSKGSIHAVTGLYKTEDWKAVGGMDEDLSHWEDWDFQIRLADHGICGTKIAAPLFTYRKNTGLRRESNISDFDAGKEAFLSRWGDLWKGKRVLMACKGCPGGGGKTVAAPPKPPTNGKPAGEPEQGVTLIQYVGNRPNTREFRGRGTGTRYRFGNNSAHQKKYVYDPDVPGLLALMDGGRQEFAVVTQNDFAPEPTDPSAEPAIVAASNPHNQPAPPSTPVVEVFNAASVVGEPVTVADTVADTVGDTANVEGQTADESEVEPTEKGVAMSVRELRQLLPDMDIEEVRSLLAVERSQASPRATAMTLLEKRESELLA